MAWTPYLSECLQVLADNSACTTDILLVHLVKGQLIYNQVMTVQWTKHTPNKDADNKVPHSFYVQLFTSQLEQFRQSLPEDLKSNSMSHSSRLPAQNLTIFLVAIQLQMLNTAVAIHEHSLDGFPSSSDTLFHYKNQTQRTESLWKCYEAVKSWFNIFYNAEIMPLAAWADIPVMIYTQKSHCIVTLSRLSIFESIDTPWDRQRIQDELNFGDLVKRWLESWDRLPAECGWDVSMVGETEENIWCYTKRLLSVIISWWEVRQASRAQTHARARREQEFAAERPASAADAQAQQPLHFDVSDFPGFDFDFFGDESMRDIFGGALEHFRDPPFPDLTGAMAIDRL